MEFGSFWNIWFWITHAVAWSLASHFTLGVPYDIIIQANREDGEGPWSEACEHMILAQIYRITQYAQKLGTYLTGFTSFLLAALATLAIQADLELARGALSILVPLTLIYATSIRAAERISQNDLRGQALRNAVRRQRFWNQLIGLLAIVLAVALAIWEAVRGFFYDLYLAPLP